LIDAISNGDQCAFDLLYGRYWEGLYKYAFIILKDKDTSKDIVQDVFVWVWEHRKGLEMQTPKSYLKTAVKYKIANYIRKGTIRECFFEETAQFNPTHSIADVAEYAELNELRHIIRLTVAKLPIKCREIYKLSREQHLSNKEIAGKLGISIKTVENQVTIALHRLKRNVEQHLTTFIFLPFLF
jgi:RNA polymerase sigma-70 factor (ECF subfamily)